MALARGEASPDARSLACATAPSPKSPAATLEKDKMDFEPEAINVRKFMKRSEPLRSDRVADQNADSMRFELSL
jgi:hypothetical protein